MSLWERKHKQLYGAEPVFRRRGDKMKKLLVLLTAVCMMMLLFGCSEQKKPEDNDTENATATPTAAPTDEPTGEPTDAPIPTEVIPDNRTVLTLSELLEKSNSGDLIMFVTDGAPGSSAIVSVLAFRNGKVVVYDRDTVAEVIPAFSEEIAEMTCEELLKQLDEAYAQRMNSLIGEIVKNNEEAAALYALSLNADAGEWTGKDYLAGCRDWYICVDKPVESSYYTVVYTDASGKNLLQEKLIVPQVWGTDSLISPDRSTMVGMSFVFDYKLAKAPLIGGYDSDTLAEADAEMWLNAYKNTVARIREEADSVQGSQQVSLRDSLTIDAKKPLSGKIGGTDYIGFETEDGCSAFVFCEPDTVSAADTAEAVQGKASFVVNPDHVKEAEIRFDINRSVLTSAEPFWEKESVQAYLQDFVNRELAYHFIEKSKTDLGCYVLDCLGFSEEAEQIRAEKGPEPENRDLNGMTLVLSNWWDDGSGDLPSSPEEQIIYDYRNDMMREHNFTVVKKCDNYTWGDQAESCILSIVSDEPFADILTLDYRFIGSFMDADKPMFADVSKLTEFDFTDEKWNRQVTECMTVGSSIYGFSLYKEPSTGVYWNKNLVEKLFGAGKGDCLYDWQASGEWTWDRFKEFARECTVDENFDGMTDIYGVTGMQSLFFEMAVLSNGHEFVSKNTAKLYANNLTNKEIIDDCNWAYSFYQEGMAVSSTNYGTWDYFFNEFKQQRAVMFVYDAYYAEQLTYDLQLAGEKSFEYGFVCFPKGPNADNYCTCVRDNILVIPNCTDTVNRLSDIAYAFDLYTDTPPELENEKDYWKATYSGYFCDSRAVDETLDLMLNKNRRVMPNAYVVPGLFDNNNGSLLAGFLYSADGSIMPQFMLENLNFSVQEAVDSFNEIVK